LLMGGLYNKTFYGHNYCRNLKTSVFVKAKKVIDNYKDANLVHYGMYYIRKKFYETGPGCLFVWLCVCE